MAGHHHPAQHHHHHRHRPTTYTGFVVEGGVSTFGYLTGDSEGKTADGGYTNRPCIAIRDESTMDHWFEVTLYTSKGSHRVIGHSARLLHCDWGPNEGTGREIDITGEGDYALGLSPYGFPTTVIGRTYTWGVAREVR